MAKPRKPRKKPQGVTVYTQKGPKEWEATVISPNGNRLVRGHGWNTLRIAKNGVRAAADVIRNGKVEVRRLKKKR